VNKLFRDPSPQDPSSQMTPQRARQALAEVEQRLMRARESYAAAQDTLREAQALVIDALAHGQNGATLDAEHRLVGKAQDDIRLLEAARARAVQVIGEAQRAELEAKQARVEPLYRAALAELAELLPRALDMSRRIVSLREELPLAGVSHPCAPAAFMANEGYLSQIEAWLGLAREYLEPPQQQPRVPRPAPGFAFARVTGKMRVRSMPVSGRSLSCSAGDEVVLPEAEVAELVRQGAVERVDV
jgi:hypothetical protein